MTAEYMEDVQGQYLITSMDTI